MYGSLLFVNICSAPSRSRTKSSIPQYPDWLTNGKHSLATWFPTIGGGWTLVQWSMASSYVTWLLEKLTRCSLLIIVINATDCTECGIKRSIMSNIGAYILRLYWVGSMKGNLGYYSWQCGQCLKIYRSKIHLAILTKHPPVEYVTDIIPPVMWFPPHSLYRVFSELQYLHACLSGIQRLTCILGWNK